MMRCLIIFAALLTASYANPLGNETAEAEPKFILVAKVDGKSFFADDVPTGTVRTWTGGKEYCTSLGLRLASITSQAQWNALDGAYKNPGFKGSYWISGRDSLLLSQFKWDDGSLDIAGSYIVYKPGSSGFQLCLKYWSDPANNSSYVQSVRCDTTSILGVLCES